MSDAPANPVAAVFDAVSSTYDTLDVDFFQPIADSLLRELALQPGERVLDVGSGAGAVTVPAAHAVGPVGAVVGIDVAPLMVERLARAVRAEGLANTEVLVGDAAAPPVDGPFDVVASSLVLFFLRDPAAALRQWHGLLREGGRLGVATFGPQEAWWDELDSVFEPYLPPQMLDARTSGEDGPFASDAGMEALVSDAGYVDVRTVAWDLHVRYASTQQYLDWTMTTGQRAMWMRVPEDRRDDVRAQLRRTLLEHAHEDGSVHLTQGIRLTLAGRA